MQKIIKTPKTGIFLEVCQDYTTSHTNITSRRYNIETELAERDESLEIENSQM